MSVRGLMSIDQYVGVCLCLCCSFLDMSQFEFGEKLGVIFQQVQKYECGINWIGVSCFFYVVKVMEVLVVYFFEGLDESGSLEFKGEDFDMFYDFIVSLDGLVLVLVFFGIKDQMVCCCVIDLLCFFLEQ